MRFPVGSYMRKCQSNNDVWISIFLTYSKPFETFSIDHLRDLTGGTVNTVLYTELFYTVPCID